MTTKYDPFKHHRRSIRLKGYDYSSDGVYFITICVRRGQCLLGDVINDEMQLNDLGQIAAESWTWLAEQYPYVTLDEWVIMPNHLHGILVIESEDNSVGRGGSRTALTPSWGGSRTALTPSWGGSRTAPTGKRKPLGRLIGAFKTVSTKQINGILDTEEAPFWQRDYYEHIIRNERALNAIREYIRNNPVVWSQDQLHPDAPPNPFNREWVIG